MANISKANLLDKDIRLLEFIGKDYKKVVVTDSSLGMVGAYSGMLIITEFVKRGLAGVYARAEYTFIICLVVLRNVLVDAIMITPLLY